MTGQLMPCPGCGGQAHRRATVCPHCGCPAELTVFQEQLSSLSTICSIIVGFGLAGLVQLGGDIDKVSQSICLSIAIGCWLFSSVILLAVLVLSEVLRRQEVADTFLDVPDKDVQGYARRCERLLTWFGIALLVTTIGVVLLGFHFSIWHGLVGLLASAITLFILLRALGR